MSDQGQAPSGHEEVVVFDFGSQFNQLIARRVREHQVYCRIVTPETTAEDLKAHLPKGIILSGGPASVYDEGAPTLDPAILDLGVPRDVEPDVARLPGVYLHDVDDLQAITERSRARRAEELPRAEAIVTLAVSQFERRRSALRSEPAVRAVLDRLLAARRDAVEGGPALDDAARSAADRATGRMVDRLMRRLAPAMKSRPDFAEALLEALGVDDGEEDSA